MRWFKHSIRNSLYGLLGHAQLTDTSMDSKIEDIRESMLDLMGEEGPRDFPQVTRRIRYAGDIQALWYLRGDLMAVLASLHGEAKARRHIQALTEQFRGVLPRALTARAAR